MDNDFLDFIFIFGIVFFITNYLISKIYFIKADPLLFITTHVSLVLSAVLFERSKIEPVLMILVVIMHLSFILGLRFTHSIMPYKNVIFKVDNLTLQSDNTLRHVMYIFCTLYILYGLSIWLNFGLLILSDDPEYYKLQFSKDGLGLISRIVAGIIQPVFFLIILVWKKCSWAGRILPALTLLMAIASSGKSVLISMVIVALMVSTYKVKVLGSRIEQSYLKIIGLFIVALFFASFVLYLVHGDAVNADGQLIFISVILERISTSSGLGLTTYLQNMYYFDSTLKGNLFVYIWNYLIVPIFAPLRFVDYVPTAGRELGIYLTGAEDYGPNPSFFGEGLIYFGIYFGWLYSFAIGSLISILRYLSVFLGTTVNPVLSIFLFVYLNSALLTLSTDFLVFMAQISSFLFFYVMIYLSLLSFKSLKVILE